MYFTWQKTINIVLALVVATIIGIGQTAQATLITKTASINDIMIDYRYPSCCSPAKQINLGDMAISLEDKGGSSQMDATFTVDAAISGAGGIWDCMDLHWLQTIWYDDCPAKIGGKEPTLPIIDPPNGGWDYMYNDGANRKNPNLNIPNYGWFIDNDPWYYNSTGEAAQFKTGVSYKINDCPTDCPAPGWTSFSTYLMAISDTICDISNLDCLKSNEMLLLAGFDWTISATDIAITDTFRAPSPFDVKDITKALSNASFSGWTVVDNKDICCIPEPGTYILLLIGMGVLIYSRLRLNFFNRKLMKK